MTITIRSPVAPPREERVAPTYTVDGPLTGLKVGLRHEGSWRSWLWIVDEWEQYLRRDGAIPVILEAGGRVGEEGVETRAAVAEWVRTSACGIAGLGTCGSCTSNSVHDAVALEAAGKPAIAAVCEEFETHGRNMARALGHGDLKLLVLPYPLENRPEKEIREIAAAYYPTFLELLGIRS
jgi:hypothetical protein